jgi:tetratricopeptide (TPR) repeat protein
MTPTNGSSSHILQEIEVEFRAGRHSHALSRAIAFLDEATDPVARANCAGILIDFGAAMERADVVTKGIDCLDALRVSYGLRCPAHVYYNLGNGWYVLALLELRSCEEAVRWKSGSFQKAKACHRAALRAPSSVSRQDRVQYLVNYANTLDSLGRHLEAIKGYDEALALDRDFGMALCNKAMAARFFANVSGEYRGSLYIWAWQMLKRGLEDHRVDEIGGARARAKFQAEVARIEGMTKRPDSLRRSLTHPPEDLSEASALERLYVRSCAAEHLFLNVHIHENECKVATADRVFPRPPIPMAEAKSLIQMIEDLSAARYLWVLGESDDQDVARADGRTQTPVVQGIRASLQDGLTKASFRLGFDILDKLAWFINNCLHIGMDPHRISFAGTRRLWWSDPKERVLRPEIEVELGTGLGAVYDIFLDFQTDAITGKAFYQDLKDMRNALTHRRLSVTPNPASDVGKEEITPAALDDATRRMLFLARCAIMYSVLFVDRRERKVSSG